MIAYTLFDTAIGSCAIAWNDRGVVAFQLPEGSSSTTRRTLVSRLKDAVEAPFDSAQGKPAWIQRVIGAVTALLRGERTDLAFVPLDMDGVPAFHQRVYDLARTIPAGATMTYGEIAARLGDPGAARAVGQALGRNPIPVIVP
ncbi:MAG TPA: methylated-DNA--[protein]-cysteine S-methyltransferase, partial [Vicinamibacterales bacterium]|nr:methylated-DNA--[protein]-cysteine S-methyltransferase [Vicinamibacterales bacterium]